MQIHTWVSGGKEHTFRYHLSYNVFMQLYNATLLGGEFANVYGQGKTETDAIASLKIRLLQLRRKSDSENLK